MGAFSELQSHYAERGIPTFPVVVSHDGGDKRPAVRAWQRVGLAASAILAEKFPDVDALGFCPGKRSGVTVLDIDSSSEKVLADALERHGNSPVVARTARGHFQAWYRHGGERRRIRPWVGQPIDVLGAGFVVVPSSVAGRTRYSFIVGDLDDLGRLSTMRGAGDGIPDSVVGEGKRNDSLFRDCMVAARACPDFENLLMVARDAGATYLPPLGDAEVVRVARSAWKFQQSGRNWFGSGRMVVASHGEVDMLAASNPDAYALLAILRRHHWGRGSFAVAGRMADSLGWRLPRFRAARRKLVEAGALRPLSPGGRGQGDPPVFSFG